MPELLIGFVITIIAVLIGYSLGKHQRVMPDAVQKQIKDIFRRVVPDQEVGPVERPTERQRMIYNDPRLEQEQKTMEETFDQLQ